MTNARILILLGTVLCTAAEHSSNGGSDLLDSLLHDDNLPEESLAAKLGHSFAEADANHDGRLSLTEIAPIYARSKLDSERFLQTVATADLSGDHFLTKDEYEAPLAPVTADIQLKGLLQEPKGDVEIESITGGDANAAADAKPNDKDYLDAIAHCKDEDDRHKCEAIIAEQYRIAHATEDPEDKDDGAEVIIKNTATGEVEKDRVVEGDELVPENGDEISQIQHQYGLNYLWPVGASGKPEMPYELDGLKWYNGLSSVNSAIKHWQQKLGGCVELRPKRAGDTHWVKITSVDNGCFSYIGRVNRAGGQVIGHNWQCGFGAAVHEIGHAFGLYHEQSRQDRDSYVTINWDNIEADKKHNFDKKAPQKVNEYGPYDYGSIMHYSKSAFLNSVWFWKTTIDAKGNHIGQRDGLSQIDQDEIKRMYKCPGVAAYDPSARRRRTTRRRRWRL